MTSTKNTYDALIDIGKRLRAIQHILEELKADNVADNDPQMIHANDLADKTQQNFHSAVRETFTTLWYPAESGLTVADLRMKFEGNKYSGEQQIIDVLKENRPGSTALRWKPPNWRFLTPRLDQGRQNVSVHFRGRMDGFQARLLKTGAELSSNRRGIMEVRRIERRWLFEAWKVLPGKSIDQFRANARFPADAHSAISSKSF